MDQKYYSVQIRVPLAKSQLFLDWLHPHIKDMEKLPCFSGAKLFEEIDQGEREFKVFTAHYYFETDEQFETYLKEYASQMRGELPEELKKDLNFTRSLGSQVNL